MISANGIAHIQLTVRDVAASRPFYYRLLHETIGMAIQYDMPDVFYCIGARTGVLVTSVAAGTPAAAAGLKAGDVITTVNGTTVASVNDLRRSLAGAADDVTLTIVRDRKDVTLKATFGDARPRVRTTI